MSFSVVSLVVVRCVGQFAVVSPSYCSVNSNPWLLGQRAQSDSGTMSLTWRARFAVGSPSTEDRLEEVALVILCDVGKTAWCRTEASCLGLGHVEGWVLSP